jgi:hypothetical protein
MLALGAVALSGCISSRSYVDPQYHKASYEEIHRLAQPIPVKLDVQFQRNGKHLPSVDAELRGHVERALRSTGVFAPTTDPNTAAALNVIANNIFGTAGAATKGFTTGVTLGAVGSTVDDNYEFNFSFHDQVNGEQKASYHHAIHTAIGNAQIPSGETPTSVADAFGRVVEDVVLNFVRDLEDKGLVPKQ